jgi:Domain of unknown function DUF29
MSNRPTGEAELVTQDRPAETEYERDFYSWTFEQARLVREGRWTAIDRENVAEEIESLGREQFAKLESALQILLMHMLKWDYQPGRRGRSWMLSIKAQRMRVDRVLRQNPGLKPRILEASEEGYAQARVDAALETGLDEESFPAQCPYSWDDIVSREFSI